VQFAPGAVQAITPRDLISWCAGRLAHYKVPAALHILPKMPTTGSGKILKTELRRMYGASAGHAAASPAAPVTLAEAAAVVAAIGGGNLACQPLEAGLGSEWGRDLLPKLAYLLVVEHAADIRQQVSLASATDVNRVARRI
jgi:hypothetical protein